MEARIKGIMLDRKYCEGCKKALKEIEETPMSKIAKITLTPDVNCSGYTTYFHVNVEHK